MSTDDLVNWGFAYVLIGAVIWMLLVSCGAMDKAFAHSRAVSAMVSLGAIFGWFILVGVFVAGMWHGARNRRARS